MSEHDKFQEQVARVIAGAKDLERLRIAMWLLERADLMSQNGDDCVAMELSICAETIKDDLLGPKGMHAGEPKLQFRKGKDKLEGLLK